MDSSGSEYELWAGVINTQTELMKGQVSLPVSDYLLLKKNLAQEVYYYYYYYQ
jgi:hypothetical protein